MNSPHFFLSNGAQIERPEMVASGADGGQESTIEISAIVERKVVRGGFEQKTNCGIVEVTAIKLESGQVRIGQQQRP